MTNRAVGIVLLVAGLVLVLFGLNATESVSDSVSETFTGRYTDKTMWYLIGGGVLAVAGALMALGGGKRSPV